MTRRGGGRDARVKERSGSTIHGPAFIRRKVNPYDLLTPDGLDLIEAKADQLLAEVGIDINETEDRELFRGAGATIDGNRVRFEPGHVRSLASTAPREFTQHARNPDKSVVIGGDAVVFAPAYGSPFVRDLEGGRRYASLTDFENFVKLTYASPWLHHSGGTICEPVDVPVNKRHLDMVYTHIKLQRPGVHGIGHATAAGARFGRHGADPVRCRTPRTALRDPRQRQRQLAARLGQRHDRCDPRLRRGQPGAGRRSLHPRWGDGTGHARRRHRPGPRRDDGGRRPRPARAPRLPGDLRELPVVDGAAIRVRRRSARPSRRSGRSLSGRWRDVSACRCGAPGRSPRRRSPTVRRWPSRRCR